MQDTQKHHVKVMLDLVPAQDTRKNRVKGMLDLVEASFLAL